MYMTHIVCIDEHGQQKFGGFGLQFVVGFLRAKRHVALCYCPVMAAVRSEYVSIAAYPESPVRCMLRRCNIYRHVVFVGKLSARGTVCTCL